MTAIASLLDKPRSNTGSATGERALCCTLLVGIVLCLLAQLHLAWTMEINWDEFHYLALVHEHARGELSLALQTFHVHLFAPLLWLSGGEILQIEVGRTIMLALECGTMALLYGLSRRFFDTSTALLVVLGYAASGNVVVHGASFRADPLAAFLIMAGLLAISRARLTQLTTGVAFLAPALALLVTVKVVFYVPAFLALFLWQMHGASNRPATLKRWVAIVVASVATFTLLYWLHQQTLAGATNTRSAAMLSNAASVTLLNTDLFPRADQIRRHILQDPLQTLLWIAGAALAIGALLRRGVGAKGYAPVLLLMAGVMACLAVYRNAFPYFFPFILPPAMLLVGYAVGRRKCSATLVVVIGLGLVVMALLNWYRVRDHNQTVQHATLDAIHAIFDRPVATIDRNGMVASFPRVGFFMTTWGLQNYRAVGVPIFGEILGKQTVPLLVLNSPLLEDAVRALPIARRDKQLFPEDRALLRDNYILHVGKIWVAGKTVEVGPMPHTVMMAVPGQYHLEAKLPVMINESEVLPGQVVGLKRGSATLTSEDSQAVTLRWADAGPRPDSNLPEGPLYVGF